jgi:hypothetical protein
MSHVTYLARNTAYDGQLKNSNVRTSAFFKPNWKKLPGYEFRSSNGFNLRKLKPVIENLVAHALYLS